MKKIMIVCMALAGILLTACKKQDTLEWKALNQQWLERNKTRDIVVGDSVYHVTVSETGLQYVIVADPNRSEARPSKSSYILVDYTLDLINTYGTSHPIQSVKNTGMNVSELIEGFQEGIQKIHTHGDILLFVPYNLGYGPHLNNKTGGNGNEGAFSYIPPYSTLVFTVHLRAID